MNYVIPVLSLCFLYYFIVWLSVISLNSTVSNQIVSNICAMKVKYVSKNVHHSTVQFTAAPFTISAGNSFHCSSVDRSHSWFKNLQWMQNSHHGRTLALKSKQSFLDFRCRWLLQSLCWVNAPFAAFGHDPENVHIVERVNEWTVYGVSLFLFRHLSVQEPFNGWSVHDFGNIVFYFHLPLSVLHWLMHA